MKKILLLVAALAVCVSASAQEWGVKAGASFNTSTLGVNVLNAKIKLGTTTGFYVGAVNNVSFSEKIGLQTELTFRSAGSTLGISSDVSTLFDLVMDDYDAMNETESGLSGLITDDLKVSYKTYELDLPILFKYKPTESLSLLAGPYLSYSVASKVKLNDGINDMLDLFEASEYEKIIEKTGESILDEVVKNFDLGLSFGLEYAFECGVFIDARYNVGLLNQFNNKIDTDNIKINGDSMDAGEFDIEKETGLRGTLKTQFFQVGVGFRF